MSDNMTANGVPISTTESSPKPGQNTVFHVQKDRTWGRIVQRTARFAKLLQSNLEYEYVKDVGAEHLLVSENLATLSRPSSVMSYEHWLIHMAHNERSQYTGVPFTMPQHVEAIQDGLPSIVFEDNHYYLEDIKQCNLLSFLVNFDKELNKRESPLRHPGFALEVGIRAVLKWLGLQNRAYSAATQLYATYCQLNTGNTPAATHILRIVLRVFVLDTVECAITTADVHTSIPWVWQEPMFLQHVVEYLEAVNRFQQYYDAALQAME